MTSTQALVAQALQRAKGYSSVGRAFAAARRSGTDKIGRLPNGQVYEFRADGRAIPKDCTPADYVPLGAR